MNRRAFTLVEVMACMLLLALAATIVVVSLRPRQRHADFEQTLEKLWNQNQLARQRATRLSQHVAIRFDLDQQMVELLGRDGGRLANATEIRLPQNIRIEKLRWGAKWYDHGRVELAVTDRGQSASYGLVVGDGSRREFFLVAGLSGQVQKVANDAQIDELFAMLPSKRRNAY